MTGEHVQLLESELSLWDRRLDHSPHGLGVCVPQSEVHCQHRRTFPQPSEVFLSLAGDLFDQEVILDLTE